MDARVAEHVDSLHARCGCTVVRGVGVGGREVYEQPDGSLRVVPTDECVPAQVDGRRPGR